MKENEESPSPLPPQKPAILIQPSLDLFLAAGETAEIRRMKERLDSVSGPEESQAHPIIVVPLGLGSPYGLSPKQAEYVINRMHSDLDSRFVVRFYDHLCLDESRGWVYKTKSEVRTMTSHDTKELFSGEALLAQRLRGFVNFGEKRADDYHTLFSAYCTETNDGPDEIIFAAQSLLHPF